MHHQRIIGPYGRMGDMSTFALEPFRCQGNQMMSELKRTANCQSDELDLGRFTIRKLGAGETTEGDRLQNKDFIWKTHGYGQQQAASIRVSPPMGHGPWAWT